MEDSFHLDARFDRPGRSQTGPGLFYSVRVGRDLELVCIDTSMDPEEGIHRLFQGPEQRRWLEEVFGEDDVRWRIPVLHHPTYCAGPHHRDDREATGTLVPLLERAGVRVV